MPGTRRVSIGLAFVLSSTFGASAGAQEPQPRFDAQGREVHPPEPKPPPTPITPPKLKRYVDPVYPPEARRDGREAEVIVKLTVDVHGLVVAAEITRGAGHGFDAAALAAGRRLLFEPARRSDGTPFSAIIKFRFAFELDEATVELPPEEERDTGAAEAPEPEPDAGDEAVTLPPATFEVLTEGERAPREVTKRSVTRREIERIPGTNGDALKALQNLPGVARTPGGLGALIVRGSAPFDTQTFVDGIYVPIIYHFGGLSSVVPTEMLDRIDFYPGNYSARYGRALGGIVDVGLRSPRADGIHGLVQVDLIDARAMLEGPVPNLDDWTFAFAFRRSWLDAWLGPVLESAGAGVTTAPRYDDYQLMVERAWREAKLRLSFYGSDDGVEILVDQPGPGEPALTGNFGFFTSWQRAQIGLEVDASEDDRLELQTALGHEGIGATLASLFFDLEAFTLFSRGEWTRRLTPQVTLFSGFDMTASTVAVAARVPAPSQPGQAQGQPFSTRNPVTVEQRVTVFQPAVYLEAELRPISRWQLVPGLRLDYDLATQRFDPGPRFNTRFDLHQPYPRTTLKGGVGIFTQAPQPQQSHPPLGTEGIGSNRSLQYGLGVEQQITEQINVSVEGFYKQIDDVVIAVADADASSVTYTNEGERDVYGGELLLRYEPDAHFFGWVAYTLARAVRRNDPDAPSVPLPWDQRHNLVVLASYRFGGGWEVGARFRLVSGNRVDANVCNAEDQACDPARINALFHAASGAYTPIRFGGDNEEQLPLFHQLDVRVDKAWPFDGWKLSAYLDVLNLYNSRNVEGISYDFRFSNRQFVTGLPILPSIGVRAEM